MKNKQKQWHPATKSLKKKKRSSVCCTMGLVSIHEKIVVNPAQLWLERYKSANGVEVTKNFKIASAP
jgi:lambda repressor-like predicted transcriptional regulator